MAEGSKLLPGEGAGAKVCDAARVEAYDGPLLDFDAAAKAVSRGDSRRALRGWLVPLLIIPAAFAFCFLLWWAITASGALPGLVQFVGGPGEDILDTIVRRASMLLPAVPVLLVYWRIHTTNQRRKLSEESGDAEALYIAASECLRSKARRRDSDQAMDYFRRAAALDHPGAQCAIGAMFENGIGARESAKAAMKWYAAAAVRGEPNAQCKLGEQCDARGRGSKPEDAEMAAEWYALAAARGQRKAHEALYELKKRGVEPEPGCPRALAEVVRTAEEGSNSAQFYLGVLYFNGWIVARDARKATGWIRCAAEHGNQTALAMLKSAPE